MYQDKFAAAGFEVISVDTAESGIEMVAKEKPDLVLLDILLPKENGVTFLKQLKKDGQNGSVPVVVFSNFDDPETKKEALDLGAKEYLIKANMTPQDIINKVENYVKP
jgi:DNA-binding response OmpR family regulator